MKSIVVCPHNPDWPTLFEKRKQVILNVLGDLVATVDHVGSTSVPGLAAKPKIDIDTVLICAKTVTDAVTRFQQVAGYTYCGDPHNDGMWTFTSNEIPYGTRLYLCAPDTEHHVRRILFRDWLRDNPDDAADYVSLKKDLAARANGDWKFYTGGKSDFINRIVRNAATAANVDF